MGVNMWKHYFVKLYKIKNNGFIHRPQHLINIWYYNYVYSPGLTGKGFKYGSFCFAPALIKSAVENKLVILKPVYVKPVPDNLPSTNILVQLNHTINKFCPKYPLIQMKNSGFINKKYFY
jgi:hypothetical protein